MAFNSNNNNNNEAIGLQRGFLGYGDKENEDPRKTTFLDYLGSFLFPSFKLLSFTCIISVIDIIMFIITVSLGIDKNPDILLAPLASTLDTFGEKSPIKEQQGQVWRFITFAVLHGNFNHLFMNIFSQLIIVSMVEAIINWWKAAILYTLIS